MIDTDFTIASYITELAPIIEEVDKERGLIKQFLDSLDVLQYEMSKCNDNLSIYLSWEESIGRLLSKEYSNYELLELHNTIDAELSVKNDRYTIKKSGAIILEFYLCEHNYYSPIRSEFSINQCLNCP